MQGHAVGSHHGQHLDLENVFRQPESLRTDTCALDVIVHRLDQVAPCRPEIGPPGGGQEPHEFLDGSAGAPGEQALCKVSKSLSGLVVQLAHDAKIHVADGIVRQDDEVRRMRVGMEVSEPIDLVERVPHDVAGEASGVVSSSRECIEKRGIASADRRDDVNHGDSVEILEGQDAGGCGPG